MYLNIDDDIEYSPKKASLEKKEIINLLDFQSNDSLAISDMESESQGKSDGE